VLSERFFFLFFGFSAIYQLLAVAVVFLYWLITFVELLSKS